MCELKEFIGWFLYSALFKTDKGKFNMLLDSDYNRRDSFFFMMVKEGFETLHPYLRFDNPSDSVEHRLMPLL